MIIFLPIKQQSQRVPHKNFRDFGSEPLYKHTLLKYSEHNVYVDTDSDEVAYGIAEDKRLKHVTVVCRQENLRGNLISVYELIKDFVVRYKIESPVAQIHVTSPFLKEQTVIAAASNLGRYDSVVAATVHHSRFWRREEYGFCPVNHNPSKMEQTQDLPTYYEENSAFYIFTPATILEAGSRVGKNPLFVATSTLESLDIDTENDWSTAMKLRETL